MFIDSWRDPRDTISLTDFKEVNLVFFLRRKLRRDRNFLNKYTFQNVEVIKCSSFRNYTFLKKFMEIVSKIIKVILFLLTANVEEKRSNIISNYTRNCFILLNNFMTMYILRRKHRLKYILYGLAIFWKIYEIGASLTTQSWKLIGFT